MSDHVNASNEELIAMGYRRTSNKYGIVARIDREDWRDVVVQHTHQTLKTIATATPGMWEDFYRRVHSRDTLELGRRGRQLPSSSWAPVGYVPINGTAAA